MQNDAESKGRGGDVPIQEGTFRLGRPSVKIVKNEIRFYKGKEEL